jgi:hypothetical protein
MGFIVGKLAQGSVLHIRFLIPVLIAPLMLCISASEVN